MTTVAPNTLAEDALAANRAGRLADSQRTAWVAGVRAWIGGYRLGAVAFGAVGVAVLLGLGKNEPGITRYLGIAGCFLVAGVLAWASYVPPHRLAVDLREGRVETVEGPVRKRRVYTSNTTPTRHYLRVGGRQFQCTPWQYEAASDSGPYRLYVLPRSHKVINLEPLMATATPGRAPSEPAGAVQAEARPSAAELVGTWRGPGITATFLADGAASARLANGVTVPGRWSIGADGRVQVTGLAGGDETVDVAIAGDTLEVRMDGARIPFHRESG